MNLKKLCLSLLTNVSTTIFGLCATFGYVSIISDLFKTENNQYIIGGTILLLFIPAISLCYFALKGRNEKSNPINLISNSIGTIGYLILSLVLFYLAYNSIARII